VNEQRDFTLSEEQNRDFTTYLSSRKILIADTNQSIRSSLSKVLTEAGAKSNSIRLASNFIEALEHIRDFSPEVVITDYHVESRCGLELIQPHREALPAEADRLFILVTSNAAESVVAEAAEEEVDAYVLRPFTNNSIRYYLARACIGKLYPSGYRTELNRGKQLLFQDKLEEALKIFNEAMALNETPSLACYYMGQSYDKLGKIDHSEQSYKNGLIYNSIHYKCSVALFDFYANQGRSRDAYEVMRNISKHFPISPQRLSKAIELAVRTQNFDDIAHYYSVFSNLDERRNDLRKCVCAALIVAALFRLRHGQTEVALDLIQKAASTAAGNPSILREIVMALVAFKLSDAAMGVLKRFPMDIRQQSDYICSDFAVLDITGRIDEVIVRGRKLLLDGVQDPLLHRIMIRREMEAGHIETAEKLAIEAESIWPHESDGFKKALRV
jgi:CheY-like chemotaxis protein